jgi:hypothetical protein
MCGLPENQKSTSVQNAIVLTGIEKKRASNKAWYENNREKVKVRAKAYYEKNLEKIKADNKLWYENNRQKVNARAKEYRKNNPDKRKEYEKAWYAKNRDKVKASGKVWRANNIEKRRERDKAWQKKNPEKIKEYRINNSEKLKEHNKKVRSTMKGSLSHKMSSGIRKSLKRGKEGYHWESLIGFTVDQLKKHIECKFTEGMSWDLFLKGEIHIDHIIPVSVHNFETPSDPDFKKCWSLKNLQPLWAKENISKKDKLTKPFQPSLTL